MAAYAMGGAYMMAFLVNFAVPAISPRLFVSEDYKTELEVRVFGKKYCWVVSAF